MVHLLRPRAHFLNIKIRGRLGKRLPGAAQSPRKPPPGQRRRKKKGFPLSAPSPSEPDAWQASAAHLRVLTDHPEMYLFPHLSTRR